MGRKVRRVRVFRNGGSQAVRLPAEFRFEGDTLYAVRDDATGEVVLSPRPAAAWRDLIDLVHAVRDEPGTQAWMAERPLNRPPPQAGVFDEER